MYNANTYDIRVKFKFSQMLRDVINFRICIQLEKFAYIVRYIRNRGNRISLTDVGKVALCFASFSFERRSETVEPQPLCETGSTICAAGLQPHTDNNFPRGGCTDVHTNAMHLEPRDRSRNILWRHSRRTRASI